MNNIMTISENNIILSDFTLVYTGVEYCDIILFPTIIEYEQHEQNSVSLHIFNNISKQVH